jgi:hypothetical protein
MRTLLLSLLFSSLLFAELDVSGHLDLDSQVYLTKPDDKNQNSFTASQTLEFTYTYDDLTVFSKLYAQEAYYDFTSDSDKTERTFARLDELYAKYDFENDAIKVGKSIEFWGSLELRNISDGFNPSEFRDDLFSTNKLGVWNMTYSHYTQTGEISLIVKLDEQEQKMAASPYVYYFFPKFVTYDGALKTQDGVNRPSLYLKYSGSTDTEYALDYSVIFENGYDSQRYFSTNTPDNLDRTKPNFGQPTSFVQNAYIVNKILTYDTLVVNSTLFKLEALYAKVDEDKNVGDYSHIALGVEHTLENFYESSALGLIAEYYRYDTFENDKYSDLELFETMQDDLFIGARYSFNNTNDSTLVGGGIFDLEYDEQVYYVKGESRFADSFKISVDYYYVVASTTDLTAYAFLGNHQRVAVNIAYHF